MHFLKKNAVYLFCFFTMLTSAQGLRTLGKKIIDANNNEVLLKGVGLGGWMLQEGYMMNSSGAADTQHEFIEKLTILIGEAETETFYNNWRQNFVTKRDIDSIAAWGFNSVRLAMHYNLFTLPIEEEPVAGENTWLTTGFEMVDELLSWCEDNEIYLILDMHAAPGGQGKDAAISDYDDTKPSLWESDLNKSKTVALWGKLAERYKDKQWIGGYDLLNEVNWELEANVLRDMYVQITNAIRAVDTNHILFIEGNWFANDFSGLTPPWDANMVYSPHKYWTYNDTASIQWVLDIREQNNVPLWLGESGENSNVWYRDAIHLFEENDMGWSWWPWKRIQTIVSPFSVNSNANYEAIIKYWKGEGAMPSVENAIQGLAQLTTDLLVENNVYYKDVVDALLRQPQQQTHISYANHQIPGVVFLSDFDLGTNGVAYYDTDNANYSLSTNEFQAWNSGWIYRNDGVDIQTSSDNVNNNGYQIGYVKDQEWLNYTVNVQEEGFYNLKFRYAAPQSGGEVQLSMDNAAITANMNLGNTGGWNSFVNKTVNDVYLNEGTQILTVKIIGNIEFNMTSIEFTKSTNTIPPFEIASANTIDDEKSIQLVFNHPLNNTSIDKNLFDVQVNDVSKTIETATLNASTNRFVTLTLTSFLHHEDVIKISYNGEDIVSIYSSILDDFTNFLVDNQLSERFLIPGRIQAEDFSNQEGLQTETTTDIGGGLNIGYTDVGDYLEYPVFIPESGVYDLKVRTAAEWQSGQLQFELINEEGTENLGAISIPVTGGWQSWQTTSVEKTMLAGIYTLKAKVLQSGFNLNWFEFKLETPLNVENSIDTTVTIYPNPISQNFTVKLSNQQIIKTIKMMDMNGRLIKNIAPNISHKVYSLFDVKSGIYFLIIETEKGQLQKKIIKK